MIFRGGNGTSGNILCSYNVPHPPRGSVDNRTTINKGMLGGRVIVGSERYRQGLRLVSINFGLQSIGWVPRVRVSSSLVTLIVVCALFFAE